MSIRSGGAERGQAKISGAADRMAALPDEAAMEPALAGTEARAGGMAAFMAEILDGSNRFAFRENFRNNPPNTKLCPPG